jgi:hypothetical protein
MDDEKLVAASDHLLYEYEMLEATVRLLASGSLGTGAVKNAVVESFVIHARNLTHFFWPRAEKPDDILARQYVRGSSAALEAELGELPEILESVRTRANKEVAHLTDKRIGLSEELKQWHLLTIAEELDRVMKVFLKHAPPELLHTRWTPSASSNSDA